MHRWSFAPTRTRKRRKLLTAARIAAALATLTAMAVSVPAAANATPLQPNAPASGTPQLSTNTNAPCNTAPKKGYAQCFAVVRTTASHAIAAAASTAGPPSTALGPADIQSAYHLSPSAGSGQTVAIVDAYGDSSAESDLAAYRAQYGLPACTTANGCFRKVDQTGGTSYPPDDSGWGLETTLDLDAVSAACPSCNILLVEATSADFADLGTAEDEAVALGAKFISNSYGANDGEGELALDPYYTHPGVAIVVSSGDTGNQIQYPSSNPDVTAVGGTTLVKDASTSRGWTETAWASGGSGCSGQEPQPDYQVGITTDCTMRATADVSADADPATGLGIYDTLGYSGWVQVGGTSLASPLITSMYAMAGTPVAGTYPVSYPYHDPNQSSHLYDVTQGSNGACGNVLCTAGPGWDGPTGLGTPDGTGAFSGQPQGVITGQVTDSTTGAPVAGAAVSASPGSYQTRTDANGDYTLNVSVGSYTVTSSLYAYDTATDSGVQVTADHTTTANLAMAEQPHSLVTGTVRDGSGHGWPMYAKITIGGGYTGGPVYTDPFTGAYSVTLAGPATFPVQVTPVAPTVTGSPGDGYKTLSTQITIGTTPQTKDFSLLTDTTNCTALGYGPEGLTQDFASWTGATPAGGWTVTGTPGWRFDNPGKRPAPTMTTGSDAFAIADSGTSGGAVTTTLTSPQVNLSGQSAPRVAFQSGYYGAAGQQGTVQLSTDNGSTWTTIWTRTTGDAVGPVTISIPSAAGKTDVRVRFGYTGVHAWWWAVGNVTIGTPGCGPLPGGLVTGLVTSSSGTPVDGATITAKAASNTDGTAPSGTALGTTDSAVTGSLYSVFSPATGSQSFTAAAAGYTGSTATVNVAPGQATRQDWTLAPAQAGAAKLTVHSSPATAPVTASASAGTKPTAAHTITLPGLHAKSYTVTLITGDQVKLTASGAKGYTVQATAAPAGSAEVHITGSVSKTGVTKLTALPSNAAALLANGSLDDGLFDVSWLAGHGDTGPSATLRVVLAYSGRLSASALATAAGKLPGATVTGTSATVGTAQVTVSAAKAAAFWAAITTQTAPGAPMRASGQLAGSLSAVWLAGHRVQPQAVAGATPQAQADAKMYTVTETITGSPGGNTCRSYTVCLDAGSGLVGISGDGEDSLFTASGQTCTATTPSGLCTTIQVTYRAPAGIYMAMASGYFNQGVNFESIDLDVPQLTVAGDTGFTVNLDAARKVTIDTPRPSFAVGLVTQDWRLSADGGMWFDGTLQFFPYMDTWVVPAVQPVTVGTDDYSSNWMLDAPTLSMSVTSPGGGALHPVYPFYTSDALTPFTTFSGRQTLQLVDAGIGSAADFAKIDARGKLALVAFDPVVGGCVVETSQMQNALNAGAAGVLLDPTIAPGVLGLPNGGTCQLPAYPDWFYPGSNYLKNVNVPLAEVPQTEAQALRTMLSKGTVRIAVTDSGPAPYQYDLKFYAEGGAPANPHYTLSDSSVQPVDTTFHSDQPGYITTGDAAWNPDEYLVFGTFDYVTAPRQTEYYGPISPAVVWQRSPESSTVSDDIPVATDVFSDDRGTASDWFQKPVAPGAPAVSQTVVDAQPGKWDTSGGSPLAACTFCRQGNTLYPLAYFVSGDPEPQNGPYLFGPDSIHLYSGSQEIPADTNNQLGAVTYPLPAGKASYKLTLSMGSTATEWQFSSAKPTTTTAPAADVCVGSALGISTDPCAPSSLIFLRYNAFGGPANAVTAGAAHPIQVTPYYQAGAASASSTGVRLWVSFDHGTTWTEVKLHAAGGTYAGQYQVPALSATGGTVSIKAQATDSSGDTVSQTVTDGYGIVG